MRKLAIASAFAAITTAAFGAGTATARIETSFDVYAITVTFHEARDGRVAFRDRLVEPSNHHVTVGHDAVKCRFLRTGASHCHAVFRFRNGRLKGNGVIGGPDHKLPIIGGSGAFNGAAGKVVVHDLKSRNSLLSFDIVQ